MATALNTLTVSQFDAQYSQAKPYYEFWRGEAIQKSMPNWIHGLLQRILMQLLCDAGFEAASEVKLKIDINLQLVPDVIATKGPIQEPYPTAPVDIVVEILSDDDSMSRVLAKCRAYQQWGFREIYVIDPGPRLTFRWSEHRLEQVDSIAGQPAVQIWTALDTIIKQPH